MFICFVSRSDHSRDSDGNKIGIRRVCAMKEVWRAKTQLRRSDECVVDVAIVRVLPGVLRARALVLVREKTPWLGSESWNRTMQVRTRAKAEEEAERS